MGKLSELGKIVAEFALECLCSKRFWLSLLVVVGSGVFCILTLPWPDDNDWIGFVGNVLGGVFGTLGAYAAATYTFNKEEKRKEPLIFKKYS